MLSLDEKDIRKILGAGEFTESLIQAYHSKNHLVHLETEELQKTIEILRNVIAYKQSENPEDKALLFPNLSIILITFFKALKKLPEEQNKNESIISKLIIYLNENISEDISLDFLSAKFFVSKYHLIRLFKSYTNTTIGQYIISKRISNAKRCLAQGENPLEASRKSGFNNYSNFYKAFVKEAGVTPSEYREQMKNLPHI